MERFVLLICFSTRIYCLTLDLSDHITKPTEILSDEHVNPITKVLELHVCQGNTLNITCPNNSVIVFDYANYGRGNSDYQRCSEFLGTESYACDSHERALQVLNEKCGESQRCVLLVTTDKFGNQCVGITKYLKVRYHCSRKRYHETTLAPLGRIFVKDQNVTTNATQTTVIRFVSGGDKSGQLAKETEHVMKNDEDNTSEELTIVGIVLGVVAALIILLIVTLVFKRYRKSKQRKVTVRTEEIEMNIESENQNQYNYSVHAEVNAQSMFNYANQTVEDGVASGQNQMENDYDDSSHVPSRSENEPLTYDVHVSDTIYNVTETSGNEPKDDENNTYDHFFGEQTEDQYDIADNKVMNRSQCKTNEGLYY
ncbi:protein eva-1 homolog C-like [Mytilus trossulus]|uniref:protein eva-1 homolog C-like n=1 Tax=Mytilus trossulus TaxID=6551 RepID=UPI003005E0A7